MASFLLVVLLVSSSIIAPLALLSRKTARPLADSHAAARLLGSTASIRSRLADGTIKVVLHGEHRVARAIRAIPPTAVHVRVVAIDGDTLLVAPA